MAAVFVKIPHGGVAAGVGLRVGVCVGVGVSLAPGVDVGVAEGVGVSVEAGVGVGVGVGVSVGVIVAVAVGVGVGVVVATGVGDGPTQSVVEMFSSHPPAMLPKSPAPSSNTYNDQIPLASIPLKTVKLVPYGPGGAGAG